MRCVCYRKHIMGLVRVFERSNRRHLLAEPGNPKEDQATKRNIQKLRLIRKSSHPKTKQTKNQRQKDTVNFTKNISPRVNFKFSNNNLCIIESFTNNRLTKSYENLQKFRCFFLTNVFLLTSKIQHLCLLQIHPSLVLLKVMFFISI